MPRLASSLGFALLAASPLLAAQAPAPAGGVTWQASLRVRPESWDWCGAEDGRYTYLGALGRLAAQQQRARVGWRVELAAPALLGLPDDAAHPPPRGQLGLGASYWLANDSART